MCIRDRVLIAEEIAKYSKIYKTDLISPDIYTFLQDEIWISYSSDILNETRTMCSIILGGGQFSEGINGSTEEEFSQEASISRTTLESSKMNENEIAHEEDIKLQDKVSQLIDELGQLTELDIHDKIKDVIVDHFSNLID